MFVLLLVAGSLAGEEVSLGVTASTIAIPLRLAEVARFTRRGGVLAPLLTSPKVAPSPIIALSGDGEAAGDAPSSSSLMLVAVLYLRVVEDRSRVRSGTGLCLPEGENS
jgi:hypothetical protein